MPASPSAAQSEASRLNGAMGQGPVSEEGRRRSALNAARHGVWTSDLMLRADEEPLFARLTQDLVRMHRPAGAVMEEAVLELARLAIRRRRLHQLESIVMMTLSAEAMLDGVAPEEGLGGEANLPPPAVPLSRRLPSMATLARCGARLEREQRRVDAQPASLRELNRIPAPEPLPALTAENAALSFTMHLGMNEPEARPIPMRAHATPLRQGPRPTTAPPQQPQNRRERRRQEALARKSG